MNGKAKERLYTSKSGIKVYSYPNPMIHSFHLALYVRTGSMYESEDECGISHFFEHAAIRNVNKKRGGTLYSELDRLGVEFNASTYSELVQFYVGGSPKSFSFAAGVLLDVLSPITLSAAEISEERSRIKAEIRENDERSSLSLFTSSVVHEGTSLAYSITGTTRSLDRITKKRLDEFRRRITGRDNIFLYATGHVTEDDVTLLLSMLDGITLTGSIINDNMAPVSKNTFKRETKVYIKNADFIMPRFTFDLDMSKMKLPEVDLIYDILLGGYSSEFFIELSEKRGLFYDISGSLDRYLNVGTLSFSFEVRGGALYDSLMIVTEILNRMKRELLCEEKCMRAAYVDNAYMLLDDPRELNFTFAYDNHIMNADYTDLDDRIAAYSNVTPERIRALAREIFRPENLTFTIKGRAKKLDTCRISKILSSLGSKI